MLKMLPIVSTKKRLIPAHMNKLSAMFMSQLMARTTRVHARRSLSNSEYHMVMTKTMRKRNVMITNALLFTTVLKTTDKS